MPRAKSRRRSEKQVQPRVTARRPWLTTRRIYILPTRACLPLLAVLMAMAYAAIGQNNSVAYLLGFFLASLTIISMVHTHFGLTRLRLTVTDPIAPVFAGQPVRVSLQLENPTGRARSALEVWPGRTLWRWPLSPKRPEEGEPGGAVFVPGVGGGENVALEFALPTTRRGRFPVGRLALSTVYPLGFFRGWFYEETSEDFLVYPAPAPAGARPMPARLPPHESERLALVETAAQPTGAAGDDYAGARPYLPGDSQRRVDWRAVARGQGLLVKQFNGADDNEREIVWLDWHDLKAGTDDEARLAQLCRWTLEAETQPGGDRLLYGLRLPGDRAEEPEIAPARGEAHLHRCLRALALFGETHVASSGG